VGWFGASSLVVAREEDDNESVPSLAEVVQLPVGRELFIDEQGRGLRTTWHLERGIVNLSIWRGERCTETFQLSVADAARLVAFLVEGLSEATASLMSTLAVEGGQSTRRARSTPPDLRRVVRLARERVAAWLVPPT